MRWRNYSTMKNNRHTAAVIITTIALTLFGLFWTTIDGQLKALDNRLRTVEQQIAAISARLGIENRDRIGSQKLSAGPPAAARDDKKKQAGGIIP